MSTADRLDTSLADGLAGLKATIEKARNTIKEENEKADAIEKENAKAHNMLCRVLGKQQGIISRRTNTEEKLEKTEGKLQDMEARVREKEQFLKESKEHYDRLKIIPASPEAIAQAESELSQKKEIYQKNRERFLELKSKKLELEQKYDLTEWGTADTLRRLEALQLELEYNLVEEGQRSEACKASVDLAFKTEKSCLDLQRGLDAVMKRKEVASRKVYYLESQITRTEDSVEAIYLERRKMEATIRGLLLRLKDQHKDM